ncbi:alkaline phosphatase [Oligoflexus tunisiensis]|uniref:alkaline phosphatase n=1 Tax=Oligoflexus tunisiensis TaxID=708132 RepID=UPI000A558852|nr:alkaline phosphatase [Oligoflexus tunisiensis]
MRLFVLLGFLGCSTLAQGAVKNLILVVGDGMGYGQVKAAGMYFHGRDGTLNFEAFPHKGDMTTASASDKVTDSAAAATAMATGVKTINGYVGRDAKARDVPNITEIAKLAGKSTGLLTTVAVSHATPAGFGAHEDFREKTNGIVDSLLSDARPNLLWGAATEINPEWAQYKGYSLISTLSEMENLSPDLGQRRIAGLFGNNELAWEQDPQGQAPRLHQMTRKALQMLSTDPDGFFLLVEGGKIDWASHHADLQKTVHEVKGLEQSVGEILNWMEGRTDTLLIVTADHETGGLKVGSSRGVRNLPEYQWTMPKASDGTLSHSAANVPVYAIGAGAEAFAGSLDNTDIFHRSIKALGLESIHRIMSQNL